MCICITDLLYHKSESELETDTVLSIKYTPIKKKKYHWMLGTQTESPLVKAVEKQCREEQN